MGYNSLGSITSTDVLYLHSDHLDTPRLATNASQTVVWKLPPHEPFGTAQAQQDPDQDGIATDIPLRFAGQVFDADTGLHYNYFRDYDPWTGRYIQSDPIGLEGGLNTYGYVLNNPINLIDPLGLAPPQNIPPCVDVAQNIAEARNMSYGQWYDAVRNGGKWDYKQQGAQYQEFGNYNYGVTAKAVGIPGNIPNRGAGWAQGQAGTSLPQWGNWWDWPSSSTSFGDDPEDQHWINEGIKDYINGYYDPKIYK